MKHLLIATAALAFTTATASACVKDGFGNPVNDGMGGYVLDTMGGCGMSDATVGFALNSAALSAEAMAILDGIDAASVTSIAGYASPEGDASVNAALARARAQAVADYLGVDVEVTVGGETSEFGAASDNRIVVVS